MAIKLCTDEKGIKIFRQDRETKTGKTYATYTMGISKKVNGAYINSYVGVKFRNDISLGNGAVISFGEGDAWLTFDDVNGKKYNKIFINKFEIIQDGKKTEAEKNEAFLTEDANDFLNIPDGIDEDLPFN